MSLVDNIARKQADDKVVQIVNELARDFDIDGDWIKSWGPRFRGALIGKKETPTFTANQIQEAFDHVMETWKWPNRPPMPADIATAAREMLPLPALQKQHTDPTPGRRWTPEERAANIRKVEAMQTFLDSQEPEFEDALREHGYGSEGLAEVCARHKRKLAVEIERQKNL